MPKHQINHDWDKHYETLEEIRKSGITNMWGASPYLAAYDNIGIETANSILCSWIDNYSELAKYFNWKR